MAAEQVSLKDRVVKGLLWMSTATFIAQVISWVSTIIVIRLLSPEDYGLMAMAGTFIFFITTISNLGINAPLIQTEKLDDTDIQHIFGIVIVAISLCSALCYLLAPAIAAFYNEERLISLIRTLIITFCLIGLYIVPQSLAVREMNFSVKAKIDALSQFCASLTTLLFAYKGMGVWALIFGMIALHFAKLMGYNAVIAYPKIPLFNLKESSHFLKYGMTVTGHRLLYALYNQLDLIIIGKLLGDKLLGIYSIAKNLASMPADKVLPILNQVSFTSYSRIQKDTDRVRRNVIRVLRVMSGVTFPAFFGMSAIAPYLIPLLLGDQWVTAVVPFQLICIMVPFKALATVLPPVVTALGRVMVNFVNMIIICVTMTAAIALGTQWGIIGVCLAWIIAYPLVLCITTLRCSRVIGMPFSLIATEIRFPLFASSAMLLLIHLCYNLMVDLHIGVAMTALIVVGAVFYGLLVLLLYRKQYFEIFNLLK